jgi:predicted GIY-YIG superfamily endonuclease
MLKTPVKESALTQPPQQRETAARQWLVYILRCRDGSLYAGITNNLARRLEAHQSGAASRYTRSRLPVKLVYVESADDQRAALRREIVIKRLQKQEKKRLIKEGRLDDEHTVHTHDRRRASSARAKTSGGRA